MTEPEKAEHATLTKERDTLRANLRAAEKTWTRSRSFGGTEPFGSYRNRENHLASLELWSREHGERWAELQGLLVVSDPVGAAPKGEKG